MNPRTFGVAAGALLVASASCTLLTDLNGYSGGVRDATDGSSDTGVDAQVGRPPPGDGGDGGPTVRFCEGLSPKPVVCKDFDDDSALSLGINEVRGVKDASTMEVSPTFSSSSPNALRVHVFDTAEKCTYDDLFVQTKQHFNRMHAAFSIKNGDADGGGIGGDNQHLFKFDPCDMIFDANATTAQLVTSGGNFATGVPLPPSRFARVEIDLESVADKSHLTMTIDGKKVVDEAALACDLRSNTGAAVSFGFFCVAGPREAWIDDVVFDYQ